MNHILIRRLSLTVASVSLSMVLALGLFCSTVYARQIEAGAAIAAQSEQTVGMDMHQIQRKGEYPISCTDMVILNLAAYDGAFYEDGTGREVVNVAALMVCNRGDDLIPYAHITVDTETHSYIFDATMIPPGASVLIPEKNGQRLGATEIVNYFGWNTVCIRENPRAIAVSETLDGDLVVENLAEMDQGNVALFYRIYMEDGDYYMGGMAFETQIAHIPSGDSVRIMPEHYVMGYSQVVYVN